MHLSHNWASFNVASGAKTVILFITSHSSYFVSVTKTTSLLRNPKEKERIRKVTQLHERMPNSATIFCEPRKWSNLMTGSVWGRDRAYKRKCDRLFYNRCFYRGESTLHWAVSHMRDTQKLWKPSWKCMFTGKNSPPSPPYGRPTTKYSSQKRGAAKYRCQSFTNG